MKQHQIPHGGVSARIGKHITGWGNKKNVGAFFINVVIDLHAGNLFDVFYEEVEHVFEGVGLDSQVVSGAVAVGHRGGDPVDVQAD